MANDSDIFRDANEIEEVANKNEPFSNTEIDKISDLSAEYINAVDWSPKNVQDPNVLFHQIAKQIEKMLHATRSNNDNIESMAYELIENRPQSLKVAKIDPNGSCLFGSLVHQLFGLKLSSGKHIRATKRMRQEVVEHISENYSSFELALRYRAYEENDPDQIEDMRKECETILNVHLPRDNYWGGSETMKAIQEMYRVNILIFNEHGTCYFFNGFKEVYKQILILAYRLGTRSMDHGRKSYNHYDSVCDITSNEIWHLVEFLSKILQKMDQ